MKNKLSTSLKYLSALAVVSLTPHAQAQLAVDFTSADLTTTTNFGAGYALDTTTAQHPFSSGVNDGQSIYSGFTEITGTDAIVRFSDATGGARIRWDNNNGADGDRAAAVFLFKKDEFLNGLDTTVVSMDAANDTVSANFSFVNGGVGATATNPLSALDMRLVIQEGADWRISEATGLTGGTFSLEATTLNYFDYDPTTSLTTIGAAVTPSFDDIQFIGYQIDATRGTNVAQGVNAGLQAFSVQAIPEPSSLVLISAALVAGFFMLRRRK